MHLCNGVALSGIHEQRVEAKDECDLILTALTDLVYLDRSQ